MSCAFKGCKNTRTNCRETGVVFFQFPSSLKPILRQNWINACQTNENLLPKHPLVCSDHFSKEEIRFEQSYTRLNQHAIPKSKNKLVSESCFTIVTIRSGKSNFGEDEIAIVPVLESNENKEITKNSVENKVRLNENGMADINDITLPTASKPQLIDDFIIYELNELDTNNTHLPTKESSKIANDLRSKESIETLRQKKIKSRDNTVKRPFRIKNRIIIKEKVQEVKKCSQQIKTTPPKISIIPEANINFLSSDASSPTLISPSTSAQKPEVTDFIIEKTAISNEFAEASTTTLAKIPSQQIPCDIRTSCTNNEKTIFSKSDQLNNERGSFPNNQLQNDPFNPGIVKKGCEFHEEIVKREETCDDVKQHSPPNTEDSSFSIVNPITQRQSVYLERDTVKTEIESEHVTSNPKDVENKCDCSCKALKVTGDDKICELKDFFKTMLEETLKLTLENRQMIKTELEKVVFKAKDAEAKQFSAENISAHKNRRKGRMDTRRRWTKEETLLLLGCYNARKDEFRRKRKKRFAFGNVLKDMRAQGFSDDSVTIRTLEAKMRTLLIAYKNVKCNKRRPKRLKVPFEKEIAEIFSRQPIIKNGARLGVEVVQPSAKRSVEIIDGNEDHRADGEYLLDSMEAFNSEEAMDIFEVENMKAELEL